MPKRLSKPAAQGCGSDHRRCRPAAIRRRARAPTATPRPPPRRPSDRGRSPPRPARVRSAHRRATIASACRAGRRRACDACRAAPRARRSATDIVEDRRGAPYRRIDDPLRPFVAPPGGDDAGRWLVVLRRRSCRPHRFGGRRSRRPIRTSCRHRARPSLPSRCAPNASTAAVMPDPQVVTSGLPRSIPAASNSALSASARLPGAVGVEEAAVGQVLRSRDMAGRAVPGRGSGSSPEKRAGERASSDLFVPLRRSPSSDRACGRPASAAPGREVGCARGSAPPVRAGALRRATWRARRRGSRHRARRTSAASTMRALAVW